jgi:TatD DNase family protein
MEKELINIKNTEPYDLIDSHAHLHEMDQIDEVIHRSRSAGVHRIVAVGMDMDTNVKTLQIAARFFGIVFPAIGYHPWSIRRDKIDEDLDYIKENLKKCCALGEVGLDYKVKVKKAIQKEVFQKVLEYAYIHKKPAIIHSRYSYERTYKMVRESAIEKAVFHWYSGPIDVLDQIIRDGHYISATPALAYSRHHQAAIAHMPMDRILIETDCPVSYKGKVSEPRDLIDTLHALSLIKNEPMDVIDRITTENAVRFFEF